jgi:hypothetical protein
LICGQHKTSVLVAELKSFSLPKIKPSIEAAQQNREEENKRTRKFNIHYSFNIMNDE